MENLDRMVYRAARLANDGITPWVWPEDRLYPTKEVIGILMDIRKGKLPVGLDIENRFDGTITAIGLATKDHAVCLPWDDYMTKDGLVKGILSYPEGARCHELIMDIIQDPEVSKVLQNGTHDRTYLKRAGISLEGFKRDTLLESVAIRHRLPHDLQYIVAMEFPITPWKAEFHSKKGEDMNDLPEEELRRYCQRDAYCTVRLDEVLWAEIEKADGLEGVSRRSKRHDDLLEKSLFGAEMRRIGWPVDGEAASNHRSFHEFSMSWALGLSEQIATQHAYYEYLCRKIIKLPKKKWKKPWGEITQNSVRERYLLNPGSDDQVATAIYGLFEIPVMPGHMTDGGAPSTNDKALTEVIQWGGGAADFSRTVLSYREHQKIVTTYLDNLEGKKRLHPIWKPHGAITGRWSAGQESSDGRGFSIQTVPKFLRNMFTAEENCLLLCADYKMLELVIVALLAGDEPLLKAFADKVDVHLVNARALFNKPDLDKNTSEGKRLRDAAKIVYGFNYGIAPKAAWERLRADGSSVSLEFVTWVYNRWFELHPAITAWQQKGLGFVKENMYVELPISGRRIEFFGDPERDVKLNDTANYPVQGTGSDIMDPAFCKLAREVGWTRERHIKAHVHDEIVLNTNSPQTDVVLMKNFMEQSWTYGGNTVEFEVDFQLGQNWGKHHKIRNPNGLRELSYEDIKEGRF
jgi:DNA polymerase I-like protein with 3'-5' exonuclease and polymerase domains